MRSHRLFCLTAAVVALALPTAAHAHHSVSGGKVAFAAKPFLVATSGGAYLEYRLTRTASKHRITIGGQKARRFVDKRAGAAHYRAFVNGRRFDAGKTFTVKVVVTRPGRDLVRVDRLFVRSRNPGLG